MFSGIEWLSSVLTGERRDRDRFNTREPVILVRHGSERITGKGLLCNRSDGGLLIRHNLPLKAGNTVSVVTGNEMYYTRVEWSRDGKEGREAGLVITSGAANRTRGRADQSVVSLQPQRIV